MDAKQVFGRLPDDFHQLTTVAFCARCGAPCESRELFGLPRSVCSACGHIHFVNPTPGVVVVVAEADRVLLGRRGEQTGFGGHWCLPGGHIEFNEDFLTAGLRETREETGVEVEIQGLISVVSNFWAHGGSTLVAVLLASPVGGEPRPSDETTEVAWFDWDSLPEMAFEADVHIIERYFATRHTGAPVDPAYVRLDIDASERRPPPAERYPR
jgi:8-oxo-dGTP diphosphatase